MCLLTVNQYRCSICCRKLTKQFQNCLTFSISIKWNISHSLHQYFPANTWGRCLTCMRASGRLMEKASLSLMLTSGYWVCWKAFSSACSCDTVKAVRLRRCFCWLPYRASKISSGRKHKQRHHQNITAMRSSPVVQYFLNGGFCQSMTYFYSCTAFEWIKFALLRQMQVWFNLK